MYGILFISVGGGILTLIGIALAILPYSQPIFEDLIPYNFILAVICFIIAVISIYVGFQYLKLIFFLAIDRKEGTISKFETNFGGKTEKKAIYEWENIKSIEADRYLYGDTESRPWGGVIYFEYKNSKKLEVIAGKGKPPNKIVEALLKFMKDPKESESNEIYEPGFVIYE